MTRIERPQHERVAATCDRCFKHVASYWAADADDAGGQWHSTGRVCACRPDPVLPQGERLARLVGRAVREGRRLSVRVSQP